MDEELESSQESPSVPRISVIAPLLIGSAAISGGLAFFTGWSYERSYVQEWGLAFTAFSYEPQELVLASRSTVLLAIVVPYPVLLFHATVAGRGKQKHWEPAKLVSTVFGLTFIVVMSAFLVSSPVVAKEHAGTAIVVASYTMTLLAMGLGAMEALRPPASGKGILVYGMSVGLFVFVLITPTGLGRSDAAKDIQNLERLPEVSLTFRAAGGEISEGPWRVIRVNNGNMWVVRDSEKAEHDVIQIPSDLIESVTYLP